MKKILRWSFAALFSLVSLVAVADPLAGRWICDSSEDQIMVEVTPDKVAFVYLVEGATVYRRGVSGSDKLVLQSAPPITLAASFQQATLKLVSAPLKMDLSCKRLSETSSAQFDPLPAENGGSLLDMDVLISKSFLESDQVKKNLKGQYVTDSLEVCIADPFLPLAFWDKNPRSLSILIENSFVFWGAPLPPSIHSSTFYRAIEEDSPWQEIFKPLLVARNILAKKVVIKYCGSNDFSSYVFLVPKVLALPINQNNPYVFQNDALAFAEIFKNLAQYQLQKLGEIKINDVAALITKAYTKKDNAQKEVRRRQAAMESQMKERLAQGNDDIVSALIRKQVSDLPQSEADDDIMSAVIRNRPQSDADTAGLCLIDFKVKKRTFYGMSYEPVFAKWAVRKERLQFKKITTTPDEMFEAINRGECQKVVGHASAMAHIIDAAKRDRFNVSIHAITPELSFLNAYAKSLKFENFAELEAAEQEIRRQQAALESQIKDRLAQGNDDIVSALIRKQASDWPHNDTDNASLCLIQLKVKKQALDGMNYEPVFAKWAARNERVQFNKITKTTQEMFDAINRGECQKVVGHASGMTQIIDASKRNEFAVSVHAITSELSFLNAYAKNLKLDSFSEWETAQSMGASPSQYLQLKKLGLGQPDDFKRALSETDITAYFKVTGKTAENALVGDYLSYIDDLEQGKKSGKSAAAYRAETNRRLEIERQEAAERAAKRDAARSKVTLSLSLICYGEDYNAGNDLRTILDMYASNTNIMAITSYMQSSQTCSMRSTNQAYRASHFTEYLRRGNLVGIRSKISTPGVGYLYSFTHRENWDVGP